MRNLTAVLMLLAASVAAQEPPTPPAQAPRPGLPPRAARPSEAPMPERTPRPGQPRFAPMTPMTPMVAPTPMFELLGEQGRIDREMQRAQQELARAQARMQSEMAREASRMAQETAREQALQSARSGFGQGLGFGQGTGFGPGTSFSGFGPTIASPSDRPPSAWAQGDPADSLWRAANEVMTKGDYRKAATLFKELPQKHPYSAYAADAMYWSAHALYRVGTTPDLQDALQVLDQLKAKYPNSRLRNSQSDVGSLQMRIAGVLSSRGQGGSDIVKRALAAGGNACDSEEQQIRSAALNALMQTDPDAAIEYAKKMLVKKDDCSKDMRRSAVFIIGNKRDPSSVATLIAVARTDPSIDVRQSAVSYLGRMPGDEALAALEELMKSSDEQQLQREAIQQLARNSNPRARAGIKALIERNDVAEALRISALDGLDPERSTQEDVTWLQTTYGKVDSPRIRSRIISAMARIGGSQNEKWFTTLANNENESIDVRVQALRSAGQAMDIAALGRLYDQTGQRQLRMELVRQLGSRKEPESIDKLGDIAKSGTDPEVRKRAIDALSSKKDERAIKLLLQLIDRP